MKTIKKKYLIKAPVEKVWDALVNPKAIERWGAGPAKMSDKENFEFKLWGGDVFGENIKVVPNKLLEQNWYGGSWKKPSKAKFLLKSFGEDTELFLEHTDVPEEEFEDIDKGWDDYYFGPLKEYLEKNLI